MLDIVSKIQPNKEIETPSVLAEDYFPIDIFPTKIQDYIKELDRVMGFPPDYTSSATLATLSVAIGNTRTIELKKGFSAKAILYILSVGIPSTQKSRPFNTINAPIAKIDQQNYKDFKRELEVYNNSEEKGKKPRCTNYLLSNFTDEALWAELDHNQRGIGVFSDEFLAVFNTGNYNSKNSSDEMYLSAWQGYSQKINRTSKDQMNIKNPFFSLAGTIQPGKLKNAFKSKVNNGLIDRMLFVYPPQNRYNQWNLLEADLTLHQWWEDYIFDLFRLLDFGTNEYGDNVPQVVRMTPEAQQIIVKWQNKHAYEVFNDDEEMMSIGGKIEDYLLRFCLILHVAEWNANKTKTEEFLMSADTAKKAIKLTEYFSRMAVKVRDIIFSNGSENLSELSENKRKLFLDLPDTFQLSEGLESASKRNIAEITAKRFFKNEKYFVKVRHGVYKKQQ